MAIVPQPLVALVIILKVSFGTDEIFFEDNFCKADSRESCSLNSFELSKSDPLREGKWLERVELIHKALESYSHSQHLGHTHANSQTDPNYLDVIRKDLSPFKKDGITQKVFNRAERYGVLYQIIGHRLYRQKKCPFPSRCSGIEHFILKIIAELPNMELIINVYDNPQVHRTNELIPVFSFSKTSEFADILYPAWSFWEGGPAISLYPQGLGRWDEMRVRLEKSAEKWPWEKKQSVGFFRGSRTSSQRDPLILLSRNKPDLVNASYTKNQAWRSEKDTLGVMPASEISLENHCRYKYLFNFRGVAASFRFKHLFLCGSLVFHIDSEWIEFFYPAIKPWLHYIPVKADLSDAEDLLEFALAYDDLVQEIALRGKEFISKHLTMNDVESFWKSLLLRYVSLLNYEITVRPDLIRIN